MRRRLNQESGFTLVESMIAMVLLVIVTGSAQLVLQGAFSRNETLQRRAEALQRGRIAMERMQSLIRSQVCLTTKLPPVTAASGTSLTFYADTSAALPTTVPIKHVISVDGAKNLLDAQYVSTGTTAGVPQFSGSPTRTNIIAEGINPPTTVPMFQYYGFPNSAPSQPTVALNSLASPTVATTSLGKIAKIDITFAAYPGNKVPAAANSSTLADSVFVRLANPNFVATQSTSPGPSCTLSS